MKKLCLLLVIACLPLAAQASSLDAAYIDYLSGNYEAALKKAGRMRAGDQTLYFLGLVYMKTGDIAKSRVYLSRLLKEYPGSRLVAAASVKVADTYFLEGEFSKAEVLYEEIKDEGSASTFTPLLYLRLAQVCSKQGNWDDKKKYLRLLRSRYPDSSEIRFADILDEAGDAFFIQVGAFSNVSNAVGLKNDLGNQYPVYIDEDKSNGYTIYKVRVGDFKARNKAETIAAELVREGYPVRIYP